MRPTLLLVCLLPTLLGKAQSPTRDSAYYVLITDTQKLYSHHLQLKCTDTATKYLELDDHRQVPIEQVSRFHSHSGTFVAIPGSAGTDIYKVEKEGPKISLYSRLIVDPVHVHDSGYTSTRLFYYRKPGQVRMQPVTYPGLQAAMQDNPVSVRELHLAMSHYKVGLGVALSSVVITAIGLFATIRSNNHALSQQPDPGQPLPHSTLSPLVIVGSGGIIGGLAVALSARRHEVKAFDIYNR